MIYLKQWPKCEKVGYQAHPLHQTHYLWRAMDNEGEVLESFVAKSRDRKAVLKFLKKSMRRYGRPDALVTDRFRSCGAALKNLGRGDDREMGCWVQSGGNSPRPFRRRGRAMLRFRRMRSLKKFASCLDPEPFQPGTRRLLPTEFQVEPCRRPCRVTRPPGCLKSGRAGESETRSHWSDRTPSVFMAGMGRKRRRGALFARGS